MKMKKKFHKRSGLKMENHTFSGKVKDGELWDHIIHYKSGQMRFEKRNGLILNTWLEDGTQGNTAKLDANCTF